MNVVKLSIPLVRSISSVSKSLIQICRVTLPCLSMIDQGNHGGIAPTLIVQIIIGWLLNILLTDPNFSYNKQKTPKPRGQTVEILDIKHGIQTLCDRLGKTQDYLWHPRTIRQNPRLRANLRSTSFLGWPEPSSRNSSRTEWLQISLRTISRLAN